MKKLTIICLLIIAGSTTIPPLSHSQTTENSATPSAQTQTGARLLILEVNFKNKEKDFARLQYTSPSGQPWNLRGLKFTDDGTVKEIEDDVWIASGQELALIWKSEDESDEIPYLYTGKSGLTGTTEQLIVQSEDGTVMDAVCWTSSKPTASEKDDMLDLFEDGGWHSPAIESCILSDNLDDNASVYRKLAGDGTYADTNSAQDWQITDPKAATTDPASTNNTTNTDQNSDSNANSDSETENSQSSSPPANLSATAPPNFTAAAAQNDEEDEDGSPQQNLPDWDGPNGVDISGGSAPQDLSNQNLAEIAYLATQAGFTIIPPDGVELKDLDLSDLTANAAASKKSKDPKASVQYRSGDLSAEVIITELMPNPQGTDTNAEWIELMNASDAPVNLGNWQLDDMEDGGSKPYTLPDTITLEPGEITLLQSAETKLSLGNSSDSVRLLDFEGTVIDEVPYESAPSGESFTRVTIVNEQGQEESQWIWSKEPTPGKENTVLQKFQAEVVQEPQFDTEYFFVASVTGRSGETKLKTVYFTEEVIAGPLAQTTFTKGTKLNLLAQEQDEDSYQLKQFELTQEAQAIQNTPGSFWGVTILIIAAIVTAGGYLIYKKFSPSLKKSRTRIGNDGTTTEQGAYESTPQKASAPSGPV